MQILETFLIPKATNQGCPFQLDVQKFRTEQTSEMVVTFFFKGLEKCMEDQVPRGVSTLGGCVSSLNTTQWTWKSTGEEDRISPSTLGSLQMPLVGQSWADQPLT